MRIISKIAVVIFVLFTTSLFSQDVYEFLRLEDSPRTAAIAGSFVAGSDDPNVIFYNPAGIGLLQETPVSFSFLKHLADINSFSLASSMNVEDWGRFGAAIKYINYGDFTAADEFGNKTGSFSCSDFAFLLGYSNMLGEGFYYGATVKFIYSGLENYTSTGLAGDVGLHYVITDSKWNFGFSVLNIGTQLTNYISTQEDLPLDMRLGFSKELAHIPFRFFFSFNRLNDKQDKFFDKFKTFTFGGEFSFSKNFRARFGYDNQLRKDLKIGTTAGLSGISIGVGLNVKGYVVDYGLSSWGQIGSIHRFGLTTAF